MAAITPTDPNTQAGTATVNETVLSGADTLALATGKKQLLILRNDTGGSLTATIDGDGGTTVFVAGLGLVDVTAGKAIVVAAGLKVSVLLNTISAYTVGIVNVTGGIGLKAQLFNC
jgi:hypothetical protein